MRFSTYLLRSALILATTMPCSAVTHARRGPTSPRLFSKAGRRSRSAAKPVRQHVIDDERAAQIQTSLIRSGYLSGEASGHWDAQTQAAMQKFQADNGWQTKLIPDSRAIIKLGLGPNQSSDLHNSTAALAVQQKPSATGFMQK
jgi:peptidoglycan hydrolase-like protein with peptidoglycan-binding domain